VKLASRSEPKGADQVDNVTVENGSSGLAFMVHLTVRNSGSDINPVIWEDNYFEPMPGERREVTATYARKLLHGGKAEIKVDGWNIE